jgi:hypothetical protein
MRGAIPPPEYIFIAWCLVKYRDNFTLLKLFLKMKGKSFSQLCDHDWMCNFTFSSDITQHINEVNI